jgi:hypothetical protein
LNLITAILSCDRYGNRVSGRLGLHPLKAAARPMTVGLRFMLNGWVMRELKRLAMAALKPAVIG